jgi:hypothetical protein
MWGLDVHDELIIRSEFGLEDRYGTTRGLIDRKIRFDAVFALTDTAAIGRCVPCVVETDDLYVVGNHAFSGLQGEGRGTRGTRRTPPPPRSARPR